MREEPHKLTPELLQRWRSDPAGFISEALYNPETGKPFVLLDAERIFLQHAFKTGADGRLIYPEQIYSAPKKSGKSTFAALHLLTTVLLFGGPDAESYVCANDWSRRCRGSLRCVSAWSALAHY